MATRNILSLLNVCQPKLNCPIKLNLKYASSKSYNDIPRNKSLLPDSWHLFRAGGPGYLHEHCDKRHKKLGPIFREQLGPNELLFIADTKMIQTVIANEGSRPHHNVPEAWLLYNEVKNIDRGLFFQLGEPWYRIRRVFNKVLLADVSKITKFTSSLLDINSDLLNSWQERQGSSALSSNKSSIIINDIKSELCKWSIEATGLMLFGQRMGCIAAPNQVNDGRILDERRAEQLVEHVAAMFAATSSFQILPCRLAQRFNLRSWQRFERASDGMIKLANEYAQEFMLKAKESQVNESLVKDLLDMDALDDDEISRSMVDLIIAAADTTSNSLQWMLYSLAKYPDVQLKILNEIRAIKSFQDIRESGPYLNAFIKEVSRLYPTAPFLARTLDHEISLGDYRVPAGVPIVFSLYTTSRMEKYFKDPLAFKPERWLRESNPDTRTHAYASLPFGVGARMCIGRRMADLETSLLLASLVLKYQVHLASEQDNINIKLKMILEPDKPIDLRFEDRT